MRATLILAAVYFIFASEAAAQYSAPPQQFPTSLVATSSQVLDVPSFSSVGSPHCSEKGEIFLHAPRALGYFADSSVIQISAKSSDHVFYRLSGDLASTFAFAYLSVTPSAKVWFLDANIDEYGKDGSFYVFGFDSDGEMASQVKVNTPAYLDVDDFAVSQTGVIFMAAHFGSDAPKPLQGKRFQALFEKSGRLRTMVQPEDSQDVDIKAIGSMNGGTVSLGLDGNFYFLRPDNIVVISESGETVRTISFKRPAPDLTAATLHLSEGLASIEFQRVDENSSIHSEFLVLDAATGDTFGFYLPPEHVGAPLCFSRNAGFIFLAKDGEKNTLVTAAMR